ncbi:MAG: hypothetical protein IJK56_11045 [Firmicutes bacterium]|nr:hypothetical protein [Bacillota bacterium]
MAQQIKLEFISDGFKAILESEGTRQLVADVAAKIQSAANAGVKNSEGFAVETWRGNYGGGRWIGSVTSLDDVAARAQSEDKVLTKAVHA